MIKFAESVRLLVVEIDADSRFMVDLHIFKICCKIVRKLDALFSSDD